MREVATRLLILDRDGVINEDRRDFVKSPEEWLPIPGSLDAIGELSRSGWTLVVATNQSAIGRGIISMDTLNAIHSKLHRAVAQSGGHIEAIFFCPHAPDDGCGCRKPLPGMVLEVARRFRVNAADCIMVGDSLRDLQAIAAVGGRPVLVRTGNGARTEAAGNLPAGTRVYDDLAAYAGALLNPSPESQS
ncbi:D-glycero-beta-D-manno-heptose 1,7-bisphosphate 7-phosphatase [Chitiniphilus purpureus]|uniref:D,D-heptose 1,7-bisphosphate phosphatase n=1 Tax=Chitiniphilus purpureus TaxID=2981137 RepID=A0ABY6DLE4_9NEIS|nr:D-glycero-beta-D-manno-heptose 1,7-bisphosphate 7-phosphatase [Chitiniphilus sp. CD1]UXY15166.1 D-glycero-beta-D-manno-heptose 1,7-bisphosphate 7-phosphatase [Chitiniphilus sp. CD1]